MDYLSLELVNEIVGNYLSPKDIASVSNINGYYYSAVVHLLYKNVILSKPRHYLSFLQVARNKDTSCLLSYVHRLDLSSYTTRGSRYTAEKAKGIVNTEELAELINQCTNLKELLVGEEMMHAFVSSDVIHAIFNPRSKLTTLDFTGFCEKKFSQMMADFFKANTKNDATSVSGLKADELHETEVTRIQKQRIDDTDTSDWSVPNNLERISFFMCTTLSEEDFFIPFFDKFTQSGNRLTRLDLAYTHISSNLFLHLPPPTHLTHLNVQSCHSLTCCSPLISYIEQCTELVTLNINVDYNGAGGSRFCHDCIKRVMLSASTNINMVSLNMGGHSNMDESILEELATHHPQCLSRIMYLSLEYCNQITPNGLISFLLNHTPSLYYLNLSRTPFANETNKLTSLIGHINQSFNNLKVLEVSPLIPKKYPSDILKWKLTHHGRRTYYSPSHNDPRFCYSKKMRLIDDYKLSGMNHYWSYSY